MFKQIASEDVMGYVSNGVNVRVVDFISSRVFSTKDETFSSISTAIENDNCVFFVEDSSYVANPSVSEQLNDIQMALVEIYTLLTNE